MSYVIKAVLRNAMHPAYGCATIPFPLTRQNYGETIGYLKGLDAGNAVAQDCVVEDIDSYYEVLNCLKGQAVNVDELDYLAKRLDSFDVYEAQQFQAACHAFDCKDIQSIINMTFCSQAATVISDFSKLEEAGKKHYLTIHGGSASVDEWNAVDGKRIAEELIRSDKGVLTPYGIFFPNNMHIEQLYKGQSFPEYLWDRPIAEVDLTKPDGETMTASLPTTPLVFFRFCERNGTKIEELDPDVLRWSFSMGENIDICNGTDEMWEWNDVCIRLDSLTEAERQRCFAAFEVMGAESPEQANLLINNMQDFTLCPGVKDAESLGRYLIQSSGRYEYDPALEHYYDYADFGEFFMLHQLGKMTGLGYLQCAEDSSFAEFFSQEAPEQKQVQGGPTMEMGGMG